MNQSKFLPLRRQGIRKRPLQKKAQSLFLSPLSQFSLGLFIHSSLAKLIFVIHSPTHLTEKGQLAVYLLYY